MSRLIQATCVAIGGRGVLIQGPPGSGKSSLALALIDRGAMLVGDDGLNVEAQGAVLRAFPPPRIAGLIEVQCRPLDPPGHKLCADRAGPPARSRCPALARGA